MRFSESHNPASKALYAGDAAIVLQESLRIGLEGVGATLGRSALDVGGRNGVYVPLIHALGAERVTVVDPDVQQLEYAVRTGAISSPDTIYKGTLQKYVAAGHGLADSAFIFNIHPRLPEEPQFARGLLAIVRAGGWIVASMREPASALGFYDALMSRPKLVCHAGTVPLHGAGPSSHTGPHRFIQLWQRQ